MSKEHLKSQATGTSRPFLVRHHADRVQLQHVHAVVVVEIPQLGQVLHQRADDLVGSINLAQQVGDDETLEAGQRVERDRCDLVRGELLDIYAAVMGKGQHRGTVIRCCR